MVHYFKFLVLLFLLLLIQKNYFTDLPRSETKLVVSDDNVKYSNIHSLFIFILHSDDAQEKVLHAEGKQWR